MTLWDRIVSLFRSAPAPRPPRPQVHGRVVWGDFDDPASPVSGKLPPAPELETPAPEPGEVKVLVEEPAVISVPLPDIDFPGYAEFSRTVEGADPLLCPICRTLVLKEDRLPLQSPRRFIVPAIKNTMMPFPKSPRSSPLEPCLPGNRKPCTASIGSTNTGPPIPRIGMSGANVF